MSKTLLDQLTEADGPVVSTCPVCSAQVELPPLDTSQEVEETYQQACDSCGSQITLNVLRLPTLKEGDEA